MAANIEVKCPVEECDYTAGLRFDPGPEDDHPGRARRELAGEHPAHNTGTGWKFLKFPKGEQ